MSDRPENTEETPEPATFDDVPPPVATHIARLWVALADAQATTADALERASVAHAALVNDLCRALAALDAVLDLVKRSSRRTLLVIALVAVVLTTNHVRATSYVPAEPAMDSAVSWTIVEHLAEEGQ